ncbi:DUF803 domain membrane protein [Talaromyces stipitatus ATCC 10500]|uniref:DUF803 domain membrane protein n=1 Tax=Talaromyces stipitatus (strain ATCC 10500 / CBS 375.48 / QM 6759 / NRRL 1006) TaxID=441959 RepID=B8MR57_TALSN|nr:DUF803 domain membrane protein [Talaromyces stipitatus ATCC 10500]EED12952.1 DUF803 domain membrane protein [Talaromyces stipitatus ATCC 10500]
MATAVPTTSALPVPQTSGSDFTFDILSFFFGSLDDGDEEGRHQRWSSFIGIVVAICGNILISFALNIQRYAHVRIEQEAEGERVRMRSRRHLSTSTYGSVEAPYRDEPDYVDNFQDQDGQHTQRSPNGHYQPYTDHEVRGGDSDNMEHSVLSDHTLRPDDKSSVHGDRASYLHSPYWWAGIVLMTLGEMGNFLAYGFAPASIVSPLGVVALISNCIIAPFLLKEKFRQRDLWGVLIAIAGAVVVVLSAETSETKIGPHDIWVMITKWEFELYMGITAALIIILMYSSEKYGGRTILIDLGLVGLFGGYTALSTKGVASLLSFTLWHVITFPISYLLIAVLVISALMQVRYINRALQRFDSTQVIPTQFVLFTLSVIIGSAVLYRDFESATLSRSLKFVGGCGLTFLGVYFITSGRVRHDDDISYGDEEDEEAGVGFLNEERYRDSIDEPSLEPRPRRPNNLGFDGSSPIRRDSMRSAFSERESLRTPKGLLSPVGSDHEGSLSENSLAQELTTPSPPLRSHSLTDNPWASPSPADTTQTPFQQESIPATPPSRQPHIEQTPPLLLRFPAAPTHDENPSSTNIESHNQSLQLPGDIKTPAGRRRSTPRTPQSNQRNSVTLRLTPSPLIAPLSSTLSAVVADSLLRGEGNSVKHHRSKSAKVRRLAAAPLMHDGLHSDGQLVDHDADVMPGGHNIASSAVTVTPGSSRLNSDTDVRSPNTWQNNDSKSKNDETTINRIRSFSDSINGHLAWLGEALLGAKRLSKPMLPTQANEDGPASQNAES